MEKGGCLGLGSPMGALSRACDSACALYVRGMSGCAHRVPTAAGVVAVGRGFGRSSPTAMHLRASWDRRDDLVRAASKQRRVAPEPADVGAIANSALLSQAQARPLKKRAAMETIAENARCDFGAADCEMKPPRPRRRRAATAGLAARADGFGAINTGSCEAFSPAPSVAHACYT